MTTVLTLGLGNIGSAIVRGLDSIGGKQFNLLGYDTHGERAANLSVTTSMKNETDLKKAIGTADVILLCVKPYDLQEVSQLIKDKIKPKTLVISVLAGVSTDGLANALNFKGGVIRAMPNIAATVRQAATAMCCNAHCNENQKAIAEVIFNSIGEAAWTEEDKLDAVTGLSGSGPAYIFMIIESLIDGGVKMGLTRALAAKLATQTVLGAATLVKEKGLHPAILKDQVTTPGGTTADATYELETRGLRSMLISAVCLATEKSRKLRGQ